MAVYPRTTLVYQSLASLFVKIADASTYALSQVQTALPETQSVRRLISCRERFHTNVESMNQVRRNPASDLPRDCVLQSPSASEGWFHGLVIAMRARKYSLHLEPRHTLDQQWTRRRQFLIGPESIAGGAILRHKRKMRTGNVCESRIQLCVKSKEASKSTGFVIMK